MFYVAWNSTSRSNDLGRQLSIKRDDMLYHDFLTNDDLPVHKVTHYFPVYEKHFSPFRNQSITFWEIGVFKGGSLQMWKRYFGPFATIVGLDIDPNCMIYEDHQIHVRIGDQSDEKFLQSVIDEFGAPDIILDDGSHRMEDICASFNFLYDKVSKNGVYMVEDLHTAYWDGYGGGIGREGTFVELVKSLIDSMHARHNGLPTGFADSTFSINIYDSITAFEKKEWKRDTFRVQMIPEGKPGSAQESIGDRHDEKGCILPCRVNLDEPRNEDVFQSDCMVINVSGWCLYGSDIQGIDVNLNDTSIYRVPYGFPRPDVKKAYPKYKNANSGFRLVFNEPIMRKGTNTLQVIVRGAQGIIYRGEKITFYMK